MTFFLIVLSALILAWLICFFFIRKKKLLTEPVVRRCSVCGAPSGYGYSENTAEEIKSMCIKCLVSRLKKDYTTFSGRAVVIQPAPGPPCYVFHSNKEWGKSFKEAKISDDTRAYLFRMDTHCRDCGQKANFLWIGSKGLTAHNFGNTLKKGFSETLLTSNPTPTSLCANCCVEHIAEELKEKEIVYLEVSGPKGPEDGFVMPMAY